jgi:hypothetical protein
MHTTGLGAPPPGRQLWPFAIVGATRPVVMVTLQLELSEISHAPLVWLGKNPGGHGLAAQPAATDAIKARRALMVTSSRSQLQVRRHGRSPRRPRRLYLPCRREFATVEIAAPLAPFETTWATRNQQANMSDEDDVERLARLGEAAYDRMYEAHSARDAADEYRDCKDYFYDAIGLARERGLLGRAAQLEARLAHIKAVFRSQFV